MMVWKRTLQVLREGNGLRLMLVLMYAVMTYRFYTSGQDCRIFIGMFRAPESYMPSGLESNLYAIGFMVVGVALMLERPSEYLSIPETMVYVRRPRGLPRFLGYCAIVGAYCLVYAGVQLAVALHGGYASPQQLMIGAVCAGWTLLVLALIINLGYLGRNRPYGYLAAMVLYIVPLSYMPLMRWLLESPLGVPNWSVTLGVLTAALIVANYALFERLEII